jgi:uncharacterized protein (DUF58 family)
MASGEPSRLSLTAAGRYWLVTAAAFIAVALIKNINLLLIIGYVLVGLLAVNLWTAFRGLRRAGITVSFPEVATAGASVRCNVQTSPSLRRLTARWRDQPAGDPASIVARATVALPGRARGMFAAPTLTLRHSYPFGLAEVSRTVASNRPMWVVPAMGRLDLHGLLRGLRGRIPARAGRRSATRLLSESADVQGLRPLRTGDSPRWIHWRTTARIGRFMVREFDRQAGHGVLAVADPTLTTEPTLEFLASLIREWGHRSQGRLGIRLRTAEGWRWTAVRRRADGDALMRALAEWPAVRSGEWHDGDPRQSAFEQAGILLVGSATFSPDPGQPIVRVDPTVRSAYYRPPEVCGG